MYIDVNLILTLHIESRSYERSLLLVGKHLPFYAYGTKDCSWLLLVVKVKNCVKCLPSSVVFGNYMDLRATEYH